MFAPSTYSLQRHASPPITFFFCSSVPVQMIIIMNINVLGTNKLAAQFRDTKINSPPEIECLDTVSSPVALSTKIITTGMPSQSRASAASSKNLDDFDMLE